MSTENKENKPKPKSKIPVKKVDFKTENLQLNIPNTPEIEYSSDETFFPASKYDIPSSDSSTRNNSRRNKSPSYRMRMRVRRESDRYNYEELDVEDNEKGWTRDNYRVVKYYISFLSYMCLVYHFYYFKLKQIEGFWSWSIIVLSSLASAISLFQYHEENNYLEISVKVSLTLFTLVTSLISAWIKKQNYVESISEIGKYSIKLHKLKNNVKAVIEDPIKNRMHYDEFTKKYKEDIVEFISNRPLISPYEWKETVFTISKYYPELAAYEFPWNKIENFGSHAMETYKRLKYNSLWKKIKHCYFCKSKCICPSSSTGRQRAKDIMEEDIKFYQKLPKFDLDYNPYRINKKTHISEYNDSESEKRSSELVV